ncbi:uncharacterized protein N7459_006481 [Penicillium hispanicum]|uniref:uncharacterized protein n=1 Tax=Penicillium hispanicum TaxID=1080232 RepID=UPI0025423806|nr:uncharacterized protein N7459_006481 [Penicillium hispanicum]KAJ5577517.1 hypothetical protein N7459_006481 [Penicillium hispanicum]
MLYLSLLAIPALYVMLLRRSIFQKKKRIRAKQKRLHKDVKDQIYHNFFEYIGNCIIDQNYQGIPMEFKPDTSHIQPERRVLADLEFKNRDMDTIDDAELVEDYIRSLELRLELH